MGPPQALVARGRYYTWTTAISVPIEVRAQELEAMLVAAKFAMDAPAAPQILITIAARFGRTAWKYTPIASAPIFKGFGVFI